MCGLVVIAFRAVATGKEIPAEKGKQLIEEKFEDKASIGEWKVANSFFHGIELAKDNHVAASRLCCGMWEVKK